MPDQTLFLGASVTNFNTSLSWGMSGSSSLEVTLAEDPCVGDNRTYYKPTGVSYTTSSADSFRPSKLGSPVYFQFGSCKFQGLLQNWQQTKGQNGILYNVHVVDPREILEGTKVILDSYPGGTFGMPNLLNVYGYMESTITCPLDTNMFAAMSPPLKYYVSGFGGAGRNPFGIPWYLIKRAIVNLTSGNANSIFGDSLYLRDFRYKVDLSNLPDMDHSIRFNGDSTSILQLVSEVCEYAGLDFYVELDLSDSRAGVVPGTISSSAPIPIVIKTSNRKTQPSSAKKIDNATRTRVESRLNQGRITSFVNQGEVTSNRRGIELRQEISQAFLVGDYRQDIWQVTNSGTSIQNYYANIWPYWGDQDNGRPIPSYGLNFNHRFTVDTTNWGVAGLSGQYTIYIEELMAALDGQTSWINYVWSKNKTLAANIGMAPEGEFLTSGFIGNTLAAEKDKPLDWLGSNESQSVNLNADNTQRFYQYIKRYADEYFGRKFLVSLPFLCEVGIVGNLTDNLTNWTISDSGWTDLPVLGLDNNSSQLLKFKLDDGKIVPFVFCVGTRPLDLSNISAGDYVLMNPYMAYIACTVEKIVQLTPGAGNTYKAIISLPGTITQVRSYGDSSISDWKKKAYVDNNVKSNNSSDDYSVSLDNNNGVGSDITRWGMAPMPLMPYSAAIPLRSNTLTYGPWRAINSSNSINGPTSYIRDTSFSPWGFGGSTQMAVAAAALIDNQVSVQSVYEQGSVTKPGIPEKSLGQALVSGGPEITNINVEIGQSGFNTTYTLRTFSPRRDKLGRNIVANLKRIGTQIRGNQKIFALLSQKQIQAYSVAPNFVRNYILRATRFKQASSHAMIMGQAISDVDDSSYVRSFVTTTEPNKLNPELKTDYQYKAGVEAIGLFRPFATSNGHDVMPTFKTSGTGFYHEQLPPVEGEGNPNVTVTTLNPFSSDGTNMDSSTSVGHDIEYVVRGSVFPTHLNVRQSSYSTDYRAIALRGPLIVAGWGYDVNNKPVPNKSENNTSLQFEDNWLRKPHKWKCGPVDLRWDDSRGVWVAPSPMKLVLAETQAEIASGSTGTCNIIDEPTQYDSSGNALGNNSGSFYNPFDFDIPDGSTIAAYYDVTTYQYIIVSSSYGIQPPDQTVVKIYEGIADSDIYGSTGTVQLTKVITGDDDDIGKIVTVDNYLTQPINIDSKVIVIHGVDDKYRILQAEFKVLCVVTDVRINSTDDDEYIDEIGELYICDRQIYLESAWSHEHCGTFTSGSCVPDINNCRTSIWTFDNSDDPTPC